jgi:hypothetical protein
LIIKLKPTLLTDAQNHNTVGPIHYSYSTEDRYRYYSVLRYGQVCIKKDKDIPKAKALPCIYLDDGVLESLETTVSANDQRPHPDKQIQQDWEGVGDFDMQTPSIVGKYDATTKLRQWDDSETTDEKFSQFLGVKDNPLQPGINSTREPLQKSQIAQFFAI